VAYFVLISAFYACASIGSPGGGDYDIDPPVFVGSSPAPNSVRFEGRKISLVFNEYIALEKPAETVIITPPQKKMPVISAVGKKISVELKDSLRENVTYTFDFTNGIVDNNEKNVLEGFSFAFSTGDVVDSLMISGLLLSADNLEPVANVMVGIHSDLSDTAFTQLPFVRTSQTGERGRFAIRNVAPGTYRLFALEDINRSFRMDLPDKRIAFLDSVIVPAFEPALRRDTIWRDSVTVDSVREVAYTRFTPDDVLLFFFKEQVAMQYLTQSERKDSVSFVLTFNDPVETLPKIAWLDSVREEAGGYLLEQSVDRRVLRYWLTDSALYRRDTLRMAVGYLAHDTLKQLTMVSDTLRLINRNRGSAKDEGKGKKDEGKDRMDVRISANGSMDVFDTVRISFSEPVLSVLPGQIRVSHRVDTVWEERDFPLIRDSLSPLTYYIDKAWDYEQEYQIRIDSATIVGIYGHTNDSIHAQFKTKAEKDYGLLVINLSGNAYEGFGQLIDGSDQPVKTVRLSGGELVFFDVKPGKYYLRYIDDADGDGQWTTGCYAQRRQPEAVYYYRENFDIKAWTEWEQAWNLQEFGRDQQKPLEITKNKPREKKQPQRDNSRQNENQRNSSKPSLSFPGR
jgi:hypothetical protein